MYKLNIMKKAILCAGFFVMTVLSGCQKMLDINSTKTVGEQNFWQSYKDTRAALIGAYGLTRAALCDNTAHWMYGDLRMGDFKSVMRPDLGALIDNKLNASYPLFNTLSNWRRFYAVVNATTIFMENAGIVRERDPKYSEQNYKVDMAQMRFLRAFAYFYMVRLWGDVPFTSSSHDGSFENKPREDQHKILDFVEDEMVKAANDLPYNYSSGDPQQDGPYYNEDAGRWNSALVRKLAAYAVLAHVAAWKGNYANSAVYSKFVLDNYSKSGMYYEPDTYWISAPNGMFQGRKTNQIFALNFLYEHVEATFTGHIEELTLAEPIVRKALPDIYVPRDSILSIFNQYNDGRFYLDTITGQPNYNDRWFANFNSSIPIFCKIKVIQGGNSEPEFRQYSSCMVFTRLEDVQLMQAEAQAALGNTDEAIANLNNIKSLRKVELFDPADGKDLVTEIFEERRRELIGEGHRWYDLVRYNKIKQNNPAFMKMIKEGGIYWPVSQDIIAQNSLITQNPYWK